MTAPRRTLATLALLLAVAIGLASLMEPGVRAEEPTPTPVETPSPEPTPTPTPEPSPTPSPTPPPIGSPESPMSAHLSGDVYGYLPYWEMSAATLDYLDWNALSAISLFSVTWTGTGTLDRAQPGYKAILGSIGTAVSATAKARGVRVELCFTSFGYTKNASLFGDPARQAVVIAELRALVGAIGADGVNVDVESLEGTWFDEYGAFLANLRAALRADNPTATVSVATNANTSGARMAKWAADAATDRIFIMAYAYRSGLSNPGAIAPLVGRGSPSGLDIRWTIDRYAAEGVPLGRVILGLPYYGVSWPTVSAELGATRTTGGSTYTPRLHLDEPASLGVPLQYEPGESVSWYTWYDATAATWRQAFYDTPTSLGPKYAYAVSRGLAGVGIWALGYDRGAPGYWDLLKSTFGPPKVASFALSPNPTRSTLLAATVIATPGSRPVTAVRFGRDGKAWGAWQSLGAPTYAVSLRDSAPDGPGLLYAQVRDEGGTLSAPWGASVVLDRTGPALAVAPELWFSTTSGSWRARWKAAKDPHGPVAYRVRYSVNGGPWKIATLRTSAAGIVLPLRIRATKVAIQVRAVDGLYNWGPASVTRR
ncbi:MAG: glycosyl hydrolase family 18 protein [Chloroflexota bacterium]